MSPQIFLMKAINPKKLREDVFRLEFLSMIHEMERGIKADFQETTKSWNTEVKFTSMISLKGGPSVLVGTDNEIYGYVNDGTPEHDISPKSRKRLVYQVNFVSKTRPGWIGSRPGGKSGKYTVRGTVHHPGIAARKFDEAISKKWKSRFKRRAEEAMRIAAQKSGHGVR